MPSGPSLAALLLAVATAIGGCANVATTTPGDATAQARSAEGSPALAATDSATRATDAGNPGAARYVLPGTPPSSAALAMSHGKDRKSVV